jgi:hypothetical protein
MRWVWGAQLLKPQVKALSRAQGVGKIAHQRGRDKQAPSSDVVGQYPEQEIKAAGFLGGKR